METTISQVQGHVPITIIRLKGDFGADSTESFNITSRKLVEEGTRNVIMDMSALTFMSSAGLRSLYIIYDLLHPVSSEEERKEIRRGVAAGTYKAPHLKLLNPKPRVNELLDMSGMNMYIEVFQDEQKAINAFT